MLLTFDAHGQPKIHPDWEYLGSGIVSTAYAIPGNRVLKVAQSCDATLQWLEHCHWLLKKFGPAHPRMANKPRVFQVRRFTDEHGTERYWSIMERLTTASKACQPYHHQDGFKLVKAEACRVLGISHWLDDHGGNVMFRNGNYDEPLMVDPSPHSYEQTRPSRTKVLSAPRPALVAA